MNLQIEIEQIISPVVAKEITEPYYFILLLDGAASFTVDFTPYQCNGKNLLFLSPYQLLKWDSGTAPIVSMVKFHGDFYCIEYHKKEVACNGILFNNIYQQPFVSVSDLVFEEISDIILKIQSLKNDVSTYDLPIIKSYLQLILALSSKEKQVSLTQNSLELLDEIGILDFQTLLEKHFREEKSVSFYASYYGLSADSFSKKIKKHFRKPPLKLIQERMTLEAKKLLHLTFKPIKEIAIELNFEDEFYFSRYFKKEVGVSPKKFREMVGISIVAK